MTTLLDSLASQLQGETLTQMSRQVGADEATTAQAIAMALPMLVGGLAKNAATPAGAQSLEQALDGDHDGSLLQNVSALFGGQHEPPLSPRTLNGGGILEHILGSRRAPAEQGIGRASGLNMQQAGKLLVMLAPLVMAWLGRRKREQGENAIGSVLKNEQDEIERRAPGAAGILNQIFGGNHTMEANQMGIFDNLFGRKKPKADFSDVQGGSSTSATSSASAPAGTPPWGTGQQKKYTVVKGDSLSKIAQREYGAASKWKAIYEANRDQIKDPDLIHPGQVLTLPAV